MATVPRGKYAAHNQKVLMSLCSGDRIEFCRGPYSHWGIFIDDEEIIHFTGTEDGGIRDNIRPEQSLSVCGQAFDKAEVRTDNFWEVVKDCKAYKRNDKDKKWKPFSPQEIIKRAWSKLGKDEYNVFKSNCEHFVNWCRYGKKTSDQALIAGLSVGSLFMFGMFTTGAAVLAILYARQKRNRQ